MASFASSSTGPGMPAPANDGPFSFSQGAPADEPSLADLVDSSRRLAARQHPRGDDLNFPQLRLGLGEIERESRKLANARGRGRADGDATAAYLLASGGINAAELSKDIDEINLMNTFEPLQTIREPNVEAYLRHEHEQVIISAVEEQRREALSTFQTKLDSTLMKDWERQKRRIFDELGQHQAGFAPVYSATDEQSSLRASKSFGYPTSDLQPSSSFDSPPSAMQMHSRMMRYDEVVRRLNEHRLNGQAFGLANAMKDASRAAGGGGGGGAEARAYQLAESWHIVIHLVRELDVVNGEFQRETLREREYAPQYTSDHDSVDNVNLRRELMKRARAFLEEQFMKHVEKTLAARPEEAYLGGDPSVQNKIRAYCAVKHAKGGTWTPGLEIADNTPIWARIFFLIRAGYPDEAVQFAAEKEGYLGRGEASSPTSRFLAYLKAWVDSPDQELPKPLRERFIAEYSSRIRNSAGPVDPYKQAMYKLIGRMELAKKNLPVVTATTEDWLWFQLMLVREPTEPDRLPHHERYSLVDLGNMLVKFGERHFDPKGTRPLLYFQVLLLSAQFERAVAFLHQSAQYQVDAVQFAVVLSYYGLLRVPPRSKTSHVDLLTIENDRQGHPLAYFNFARAIHRYTRLFAQSDPAEALQYLCLLCLNADLLEPTGKEYLEMSHDFVRELVLETRRYAELLGDVRNDGTKAPGLVERFLKLLRLQDVRDYQMNIVKAAASRSDAEKRTMDAIQLYNLAEEYDTVVAVINKELGATLMEPPRRPPSTKPEPETASGQLVAKGLPSASLAAALDIATLAEQILLFYESSNITISVSARNRETCRILLKLKKCVALFVEEEYETVLNTLESLELILMEVDAVKITRKAEEFKDMDENIARNFSEILLMAMNAIYKCYVNLKESPYGDVSRQQRMATLRTKARAVMMSAGMLRYRMTSDTYSQLTRLDVFIH